MIEIRALQNLELADLERIGRGYTSDRKYAVAHTDTADYGAIELCLVTLKRPFIKKYAFDEKTLDRYKSLLKSGFSFGAYDSDLLVGILISEVQLWNESLSVHEFHVAETHQRAGIGSRLMQCAVEKASKEGLRIVVCETQNTNVTGIEIYHKFGFRIEGVDISHYSNADYPDGEIAVFMKRRLT